MPISHSGRFEPGPDLNWSISLTLSEYNKLSDFTSNIATFYFLDLCVVNIAKLKNVSITKDRRKVGWLKRLRDLDRPQHSFSYLLALMERVSNSRDELSDENLEREILSDMDYLRRFFKKARVVEPNSYVVNYLRKLRRAPVELDRDRYLKFLNSMNGDFRLMNSVGREVRFEKAAEIMSEADSCGVSRQHPVVLIALACLYGNLDAKGLMKFKLEPAQYNAENVLSDIVAIQRFAEFKIEVCRDIPQAGKCLLSDFLTDDKGLSGIYKLFKAKSLKVEDNDDTSQIEFSFEVNMGALLSEADFDEINNVISEISRQSMNLA